MDGTIPPDLFFEGTLEAQTKLMTELALARLEFADVSKDRTGQYGYQTFKYATLGGLTAATLPALAAHGIAVIQAINPSRTEGRQRITTMLCGHGAKIVSSLDFDPRLTNKDDGKGEAIKEYGKLRTYLRRYEFQTLLMLDAEPDADEAGMKPQEPQKRREAPTPPQSRQEPKAAPAPRQEPRATQTPPPPVQPPVEQHPGHFNKGQLQVVPSTPKSDPLLEKLTTVAPQGETPVAPEPTVERETDEPASEELQNELIAAFRTAGMTKIQFAELCMSVTGVPPTEVRSSSAATRKMLEALKRQKSVGAA